MATIRLPLVEVNGGVLNNGRLAIEVEAWQWEMLIVAVVIGLR